MKTKWPAVPIEELCSRVTSGGTPSRSNPDFYKNGTIPWIKTGELNDWYVDSTSEKITDEAIRASSAKIFPPETVLLAMYGDGKTMGTVGLTRVPSASNQACCAMIVDPTKSTPKFLLYSLIYNRPAILKLTVAGAQRNLNGTTIKRFEIGVPPLETQHLIASILSAYDDLIENNTRRIAILEEMARRIYEEWFVHFRFPGHEQVKMVESELGLIPEGWKVQPLGELLEHHIGGGWGQENHSDDFPVAAYVIRGTDIPDARFSSLGRSPLRFHKESNFRTRKLQPGDIVFEVSGGSKDQPVGRAVLLRSRLFISADKPIICASFCRLVRANKTVILPELLQLHFERIYESREIMKYQTQSTGITNFKFTIFTEKEMILVPPQEVQKQFQSFVDLLYGLASTLGVKNANLRTTRDLLLPKLISGELDVSKMPAPEEAIAA